MKLAITEKWSPHIHGEVPEQTFSPYGHHLYITSIDINDWMAGDIYKSPNIVKTYDIDDYSLAYICNSPIIRFQRKFREQMNLNCNK